MCIRQKVKAFSHAFTYWRQGLLVYTKLNVTSLVSPANSQKDK